MKEFEKLVLLESEKSNVSIPAIDLESLECKTCNKVFKSKTALKNHHASIHKGVRYNCNDCGSEFTLQSSLRTHIKAVHAKRPKLVACDQCDYETPRPDNLKTHKITVHSFGPMGEPLKPYECDK